jgi:hypothetical protein
MTRRLVELSVTTGIPFQSLAGLDHDLIDTFIDVVNKGSKR